MSTRSNRKVTKTPHTPRRSATYSTLHRVGIAINDNAISNPQTPGARMVAQRLKMGLKQEDVADRVVFAPKSGQQAGVERSLSRTTYCMYERDDVIPGIDKIEAIADILKVSPAWLAYGVETDLQIDQVQYDAFTHEFRKAGSWGLSPEWVQVTYGLEPSALALAQVTNHCGDLAPGEIAIVHRGQQPTETPAIFIVGLRHTAVCARVVRLGTGVIRIYQGNQQEAQDYEPEKVAILGAVIGKIASKPLLPQ